MSSRSDQVDGFDRLIARAAWAMYLGILVILSWDRIAAVLSDKDAPAWVQAIGSIAAVIAAFLVTYVQNSSTTKRELEVRNRAFRDRLAAVLVVVQALEVWIVQVKTGLSLARDSDALDWMEQDGRGARGMLRRFTSPVSLEHFLLDYDFIKTLPWHEFRTVSWDVYWIRRALLFTPARIEELRAALGANSSLEPSCAAFEQLHASIQNGRQRLEKALGADPS